MNCITVKLKSYIDLEVVKIKINLKKTISTDKTPPPTNQPNINITSCVYWKNRIILIVLEAALQFNLWLLWKKTQGMLRVLFIYFYKELFPSALQLKRVISGRILHLLVSTHSACKAKFSYSKKNAKHIDISYKVDLRLACSLL